MQIVSWSCLLCSIVLIAAGLHISKSLVNIILGNLFVIVRAKHFYKSPEDEQVSQVAAAQVSELVSPA